MKLQNLTVIFIIIIIPIILVVSYYTSLQMNTIKLQTSYDTKLQEATKEAMSAFEINTVEWNSTFSNLADSKRRDVQASINTFLTSMANKMGVAGTAKEYMKQYVPAIAYTLYDGYYIQSMTDIDNGISVGFEYNEESSGLDAKEYKNESNYGMQAFTPYSETLTNRK